MKMYFKFIVVVMLTIPALAFAESLTDRLFSAAQSGEADVIKELIKEGANVNAVNKYGWTVLMQAAYFGKVDAAKTLIEAGADVNAKSNDGWTALMEAAHNGNVEMVKILIEEKADVNAKMTAGVDTGQTALMVAAWFGKVDAVKALIESGADVNAKRPDGQTVLIEAEKSKNAGVDKAIKALIEAGAVTGQYGVTPLMVMAGEGNIDAVKDLIEAKADINAMDKDNCTALMWAEQNNKTETVEVLKKEGAKYNPLPEYISAAKPGNISIENTDDYYPGDDWRTSTPEAQGMDSEYLSRMLDYIRLNNLGIHSVVVIRHGYLVLEAYKYPFGKDNLHALLSATKSFVSALTGLAIKEGYIKSVDQRVLPIFDGNIQNLDDNKRMITIKHMLTMSSGIDWQEPNVLQLLCDLTIAAENARFGQTGPRVGSFDAGFGAGILAQTIGLKKAKEVLVSHAGNDDAEQALRMGWVNTVVPLIGSKRRRWNGAARCSLCRRRHCGCSRRRLMPLPTAWRGFKSWPAMRRPCSI